MSSATTTVRFTDPGSMAAAVPSWLGYTPTESFVVICCHEPRGRVGLTMRFDIPPAALLDDLVDEAFVRAIAQHPSRVMVLVYNDAAVTTRPLMSVVTALTARLEQVGVRITDAMHIAGSTFRSYLCDDDECCPAGGRPLPYMSPEVEHLNAEQVLRGRNLAPLTRDDLERSLIAPPRSEEWRRPPVSREAGYRLWRSARERITADPTAQITATEAVDLSLALQDVLVRDSVIGTEHRADMLVLTGQVLAYTPWPFRSPIAAVHAWLTYCEGGGAVVSILLEQLRLHDPGYSLGRLLAEMVLRQEPPAVACEIVRAGATADL